MSQTLAVHGLKIAGHAGNGQRKRNARSLSLAALQCQATVHRLHEPARNIEAEASTADMPGRRMFQARKGFEEGGLLLLSNADAMVKHRDVDVGSVTASAV